MRLPGILRQEIQIPVAWSAVAVLWLTGIGHGAGSVLRDTGLFAVLFAVILWGAFTVVRHAEEIAHRLGEPYGTLVLTLSVTVIEVSFMVVVMLDQLAPTTLPRDTIFAVLMITLNAVAGLCLLLGGLRHHEQDYNLQGTRAFMAVILPLSVIALIMPNFTTTTAGPTLSQPQAAVFGALILLLYLVFLGIQTVRHAGFFIDVGSTHADAVAGAGDRHAATSPRSTPYHAAMLLAALLPIVLLTEELSDVAGDLIAGIGAPEAFVGVLIAILVLSPEAMGALRAARANQLQRAVNITLGSALATIGLTVPAVLAIGIATDRLIHFGLEGEEMVLLALTLMVAGLTFGGTRTSVLQGVVHLVLFVVFLVLLFNP